MPWAIIGPIAGMIAQQQANTGNDMVHRQRIQHGGMNMLISNNQHGKQQSVQHNAWNEQHEQQVLPESRYKPSMISPNPLMDSLTALLKKDRETNSAN